MTPHVLVVDDSLTVRMDLVEAFEAAGFHATPCATAAEARAAFAGGAASVVVLDVLLPDGDGVELLGELRASPLGASVAVLMLSSEAEVKDRVRGLRMGADAYVGKPYDAGYVVAKALELARTRPAPASLRPTVLVIDDSVTFREALRSALEAAGYDVLVASDGEDGLRMAAAQRPHGIVVDGILPGMDGASVIRRVRLDVALRDVPCVLLTGLEDGAAELRALDAGADAFVRKEEDIDVILARVGAALRRSGGERAKEASSAHGPKKILAVDDSPTYLTQLSAVLRAERYEVVVARDGEEALELLAVEPVDCILLDRLMPGLGGQETCRRIKGAPIVRDIPLIMLTGLDDRNAMLDGLGAGADD
ncbi:MAG TPA: response regulator, partial [Polyangiaceae bacterium]|nr:response regulator [Polyangiaceae bacterium]